MRRLLVTALLLSSTVLAAEPTFYFLKVESIDPKTVIAPPPVPNSDEDVRDMAEVVRRQAEVRSEKICARARAVGNVPTLKSLFGQILTEAEVASWNGLFVKIQNDHRIIRTQVKALYSRPYPFVANPEVIPCLTIEAANSSYPSGHSGIAYVSAAVFSMLDPTREAAFDAMADQISGDRVTVGAHYPSDLKAGQKLAEAILAEFLKSAEFRAEIDRLKKSSRGSAFE